MMKSKVNKPMEMTICQTKLHKKSNTETSEKCQTQRTAMDSLLVQLEHKPESPVKDMIALWESKAKPSNETIKTSKKPPKPRNRRVWAGLKYGLCRQPV